MNTVFFSWQADTPTREGRNFIERALQAAIDRISGDATLEEAVRDVSLDKDTKGVAGSPPIVDTILRKIDDAAVFVPDLTFIGKRPDGRPTPNPNVLIEYGWALKSRGHGRMVPVMNTAHGEPTAEAMPFDMRHLRNPITYSCAEGASEQERRRAREALSKKLEDAIRAVLDGHPPALPARVEFKPREPADGRGRFKPAGDVIGVTGGGIRSDFRELRLSGAPAAWLRVMPKFDPGRRLTIDALEAAIKGPSLLMPFGSRWSGVDFLRTHEGYGTYAAFAGDLASIRGITFAFTSGEVWGIDTYWLEAYRDQEGRPAIPREDNAFRQALHNYAAFLDRIGVPAPYTWVAGMENLKGRVLYIPAPPGRSRLGFGPDGQCITDVVVKSGQYSLGASPAEALKPFFQELYNSCGVSRREWQDT